MKQQKERQHSLTTENLPKKTKQGVSPIAQVVIDDVLHNVYSEYVKPVEDSIYLRDYSYYSIVGNFVDTYCKFANGIWFSYSEDIHWAEMEDLPSDADCNWAIPASKDTIEDFSESEKDFINISEDAAKIVLHSKKFAKGNYKEGVQSKHSCKEDFRNTVIYFNQDQLKLLESYLLNLGIQWMSKTAALPYYTNTAKFLAIYDDYTMLPCGEDIDIEDFKELTFKVEHSLSFSEITPKQETIEYAGNIYDKAQFENMIAKLTKLNENI